MIGSSPDKVVRNHSSSATTMCGRRAHVLPSAVDQKDRREPTGILNMMSILWVTTISSHSRTKQAPSCGNGDLHLPVRVQPAWLSARWGKLRLCVVRGPHVRHKHLEFATLLPSEVGHPNL